MTSIPFFCSHDSDLDKRYQAAKHKLFQIQVAEDGEIEGSGTTEGKPQEENSEAMKAYVMFVRDTMAILIKKFKPDFDVSMNMQSIENAAKVTVEMTKTIYTVNTMIKAADTLTRTKFHSFVSYNSLPSRLRTRQKVWMTHMK